MNKGKVVSIHMAQSRGGPLQSLDEARALAGRGLEGDRHIDRNEGPEGNPTQCREVTLIEAEAVEALRRDYGVEMAPEDARRNVVTRGVALNHLVGREFKIGEVPFLGIKLCEPCDHLAGMTDRRVLRGLVHRGGLRARILADGVIHVGDPIEAASS